MTNVDFFTEFAATQDYFFWHDRYFRDYTSKLTATDEDDPQVKIVHNTDRNGITVNKNDVNEIISSTYRGTIYAVIKSSIDEMIHNPTPEDGKYQKRVKDLIEDGGIQAEILEFMGCDPIVDLTMSNMNEEYNVFSDVFDGVSFQYVLTIRKGVNFPDLGYVVSGYVEDGYF